ncbi:MAG: esterase-like activity of phytase family protein [Bacteroidales bacterium]
MPRRAAAIVLLLAALGGCRAPAGDGIAAESMQLSPETSLPARLGAVEVLSITKLTSARPWFGGISGLSYDDRTVTAINDVGHWLRFRMDVDAQGRPTSFADLEVAPLGGLDGSRDDGDAEEVRLTADGWLVSFERRHRLLLYGADLSGQPTRPALPAGYELQPENGGVEAMTPLADGSLLLLSEEGVNEDGLGQAWIGRPGAWRTLSYRRSGQFRPTSATLLPGGDVLVLERSFSLLGGFSSRLVRVAAADLRPGAVIAGRELFTLRSPMLVDNYEGISVHQRQDGRLVAYLIADDNFSVFQATLLMAVLLPE